MPASAGTRRGQRGFPGGPTAIHRPRPRSSGAPRAGPRPPSRRSPSSPESPVPSNPNQRGRPSTLLPQPALQDFPDRGLLLAESTRNAEVCDEGADEQGQNEPDGEGPPRQ